MTEWIPNDEDADSPESPWPEPLREAAFHGPLGKLARAIEPHSEADVAAVLVQLLAGFGSLVGRGPGIQREGDFHATNLFVLVVGKTSLARKGTSWGRALQMLEQIDGEWAAERVQSGISSGEGIVHAVRDLRRERRGAKKGELPDDDGLVEEVQDPGVQDKRLLVCEGDFDRALKMMKREGNVLSDTLRSLWEKGRNGGLTKTNPETVRNAHVSVIGHITFQQLQTKLDKGEVANGLVNRFLVVCATRSRSLPHGGDFDMGSVEVWLTALRQAAADARQLSTMPMTEPAMRLWEEVYESLNVEYPEPLGDVIARGPAQVVRLAVVYAIADRAHSIDEVHLLAALAVWNYCEASAAHVFGGRLFDPRAQRLLDNLYAAGDRGLSKGEIWKAAGSNNILVEALDARLRLLRRRGLIRKEMVPTAGRPAERWFINLGNKGALVGRKPSAAEDADVPSHATPLHSHGGASGSVEEQARLAAVEERSASDHQELS